MKRILFVVLFMLMSVVYSQSDVPDLVNIPGTIQSSLGCPGEWAPDCETTALDYDETDDVFIRVFDVPAGSYEYKVAINGSWGENYGAFADQDGGNITLAVPEDMSITFAYDHKTNWILDTVRQQIVTVSGDFQTAVGCAEDYQLDCMRTWLQDVDGDGIYAYSTTDIQAGDYETRAVVNFNEDEIYGADGELDGESVTFNVPEDGATVNFLFDSNLNMLVVSAGGSSISAGSITELTAYWVSADTLLWDVEAEDGVEYALLSSPTADMSASIFGLSGDYTVYPLTPNDAGVDDAIVKKFPHLADLPAFTLGDDSVAEVSELLRGQNVIATLRDGEVTAVAGLQIPGAIDDLYTTDAPLGINIDGDTWTLSLWAPTANNVSLNLFADTSPSTEPETVEMTRSDDGVWTAVGDASWDGLYYTYTVSVYVPSEGGLVDNEVTDPYSIALSQNSLRSLIVDITADETLPDGWADLTKSDYGAPEDITVYELHMRDFSAFDETVPEDLRGTYLAFTVDDSNGMTHLKALSEAGLTHLHLLPTFDIATINENRARTTQFTPDPAELAEYEPTSEEQQAEIDKVRDADAFNWGYDPYHFMAPEGSYSTDPNGTTRILEYRQMVQAVNNAGLRFVQDVVFNHTNASGQSTRSVLDKVVPGYYHRLNQNGRVHTSTCCPNTATEHNMMRRLMVDTVILNAVHYKVDGFRFDLMGHHMLDDMLAVRDALDALTISEHGVDGASIYVYGEGWNFGEVANNAHGFHATQANAAGTGIGTFNDRLRDAVRGGSPFGDRDKQGLGNGVYTFPNGIAPENEDLDRALLFADLTRVGLAGNLIDYTFTDRNGDEATGFDVPYNDSPAGYTLDPQENVVYVSKHDNETLFDNIAYRIPTDMTAGDITRMQILSLSYPMYSQGVPFFHAGSDMLRSKSMDRDSFNSGDWFNRIDWTYQINNFRVGMPPKGVNESQYDIILPVLENEGFTPTPDHIALNRDVFRDMLNIRYSSPLFRLQTAEQVQSTVGFLNTGAEQMPGVIVMALDDVEDLDPDHSMIVVVFNGQNETIDFTAELEGAFELHPAQVNGADEIVKSASYDNGTFSVPALTTAVFVVSE